LNVGNKTETVKVRVVDAAPKLEFTLDEADTSNNNFLFNKTTGKYHATFAAGASPAALKAEFVVEVSDMTVATTGTSANLVSYTLVRKYPKVTNEFTNTALTKLKNEVPNVNSGLRVIDDSATGRTFLNLLRTSVDNTGSQFLSFSEAGEYVFELTVNGVKETVTLVAEAYPTIKVTGVTSGTTQLDSQTASSVVNYLVPSTIKSVVVKGTGVSLPAGVFYKVTSGGSLGTVSHAAQPILNVNGSVSTYLSSNGLKALDLTAGIPLQLRTDGADIGLINSTTGWTADKVGIVNITFYNRVLDTETAIDASVSTPVVPIYDFEVLGHVSINFWNEPSLPTIATLVTAGAITGITAPVVGATPVTTGTLANTTLSVQWLNPNGSVLVGNFAGSTVYKARITIAPAFGFTLVGVTDVFTVTGGTVAARAADSNILEVTFPVTGAGPSATVGTLNVAGSLNQAVTAVDLVITISNTTFTGLSTSANVASWITNLPTGLTAEVKAGSTSTSVTIEIAGTPTQPQSAAMTITIPAASLASNADLAVTTNANAKFTIS
jgi:hypothetical protein